MTRPAPTPKIDFPRNDDGTTEPVDIFTIADVVVLGEAWGGATFVLLNDQGFERATFDLDRDLVAGLRDALTDLLDSTPVPGGAR